MADRALTVFATAISIMLLLGVEKVRSGARQTFADTISGTDLIVGACGGNIQLLLYSVFRIGNATNARMIVDLPRKRTPPAAKTAAGYGGLRPV